MFAKNIAMLALIGWCMLSGEACRADDYISPTDERVRLTLGVMHVSNSTRLRSDSDLQTAGTDVNGEDQFGLDRSDWEPKFQAVVRTATRHRLFFDYFTLDRSGDTTVTSAIAFRDSAFLPGDPLQTRLELRTFGIAYGYSFWHSEKLEIAATVGVHATDISTRAEVHTTARQVIQTDDLSGPIPTLGLAGTWVVSKRFYVDAHAQYMTAHVSDIDGSIGFYSFEALYRFRPNVSMGLGYTQIVAHLASTKGSQAGYFDFNTKGPELFVRVAF